MIFNLSLPGGVAVARRSLKAKIPGSNPGPAAILRQGYGMALKPLGERPEWQAMHYTYILLSSKFHKFYYGSTIDLQERLRYHNSGMVKSTKFGIP